MRTKYLKLTLQYTNSKFPFLFGVIVVPSILLTFLVSPSGPINFLCNYFSMDRSSFSSIWMEISNIDARFVFLGIIGFLVLIWAMSFLFGAINRHMLTGHFDMSFKRMFTRLDYNFLTAAKVCIAGAVVFELHTVINTALFALWARIMPTETAALVLSIISFVIIFIVSLFIFSIAVIWAPNMLHAGYKTKDAFTSGVSQVVGNIFNVAFALFVPLLPFIVIMILVSVLNLHIGSMSLLRVVDSVTFVFVMIYYAALSYSVFYDVTGTERADLSAEAAKGRFSWNKKPRKRNK